MDRDRRAREIVRFSPGRDLAWVFTPWVTGLGFGIRWILQI